MAESLVHTPREKRGFSSWRCCPYLMASRGIWAALACSHPRGVLALAWRSKLADSFVAQESKLTCKAEIPLIQNLRGLCWGKAGEKEGRRAAEPKAACLFTYRQSQRPFLMPQKNNKCSRFMNFYLKFNKYKSSLIRCTRGDCIFLFFFSFSLAM